VSLGFHGNAFVYASFLGLKSALKTKFSGFFWPRHIPWETGINQPRFQVL